jgi:hypothetical protein
MGEEGRGTVQHGGGIISLEQKEAGFGLWGRLLAPPVLEDLIQGLLVPQLLSTKGEVRVPAPELLRGEGAIKTGVVVAVPGDLHSLGSHQRGAKLQARGKAVRPLLTKPLRIAAVGLDHQQPLATRLGFSQEGWVLDSDQYSPWSVSKKPGRSCGTWGVQITDPHPYSPNADPTL